MRSPGLASGVGPHSLGNPFHHSALPEKSSVEPVYADLLICVDLCNSHCRRCQYSATRSIGLHWEGQMVRLLVLFGMRGMREKRAKGGYSCDHPTSVSYPHRRKRGRTQFSSNELIVRLLSKTSTTSGLPQSRFPSYILTSCTGRSLTKPCFPFVRWWYGLQGRLGIGQGYFQGRRPKSICR